MKYMILIHIALPAVVVVEGNSLDSVLFDLSAGGLGAPRYASGSRLGCEAKGAVVSVLRVSCWRARVACPAGSRDGAASPCWRRHPHRDLAVAGTGTRRRNDHVHHPCPYVNRLAGLVMYVLAW